MNSYFYRIYLPYLFFGLFGLYIAVNEPQYLWYTAFFIFIVSFLGTGVGLHRLFSHRSYETWRPVELFLAFCGTICAYGPLLFWVANHMSHHNHADTDLDPHSPKHGFWHSFLTWNLTQDVLGKVSILSYPAKRIIKDKTLRIFDKYFVSINYTFLIVLALVNWKVAFAGYTLAVLFEKIRVGITNVVLHSDKIPGNYRRYDTNDNSQNSVIVNYLFGGFGLHNTHHANPRQFYEKEAPWEFDPEGLFIKLIRKPLDPLTD